MYPIQHQVILQDTDGQVWEGEVITFLPLDVWAEWRGYIVLEWEGWHPAILPRTQLKLKSYKSSGVYIVSRKIQELLSHLEGTFQK